jgi:hypothetical protein
MTTKCSFPAIMSFFTKIQLIVSLPKNPSRTVKQVAMPYKTGIFIATHNPLSISGVAFWQILRIIYKNNNVV